MKTLLVGLGGAAGSIARYHLGLVAARRWPGLPWGTLLVNLVGSFLLALLMGLWLEGRVAEPTRVALGVGVLGGFTTYSSFNYEMLAMLEAGAYGRAAAYVAATLLGCLALGLLGWLAARALS